MADKKYYHSEVIEFQNDDKTVAKQLTIKRLRLLTTLFGDYEKDQTAKHKRVKDAVEAARGSKGFNEDEIVERVAAEIEAEGGESYLDILVSGTIIALHTWGVKDQKSKSVEVDRDYVEDNLDYPTMVRICEIAGSMELGNLEGSDGSGKAGG